MRSSRFAAATLYSMIAAGTLLGTTGIASADTNPNTATWCARTGYKTTIVTPPSLPNLFKSCPGGFATH